MTYGICLGIAWITFVKTTGKSPLWPGQWAPFLGFYAGLWTVQVSCKDTAQPSSMLFGCFSYATH